MRAWALVDLGDSESIDLFLREQDAENALADCLRDGPDWIGSSRVEPVELDGDTTSVN